MNAEAMYMRYAVQLALQAAKELDARPRPIIVAVEVDAPRLPELDACAPMPTLH